MSHSKKNTPNRRTRLDRLAYAACAVAIAALAVLNVLAGCDPSPPKGVRSAQTRISGPAAQKPV
jgi:hypothetical protein